jgi:hypothetical protein
MPNILDLLDFFDFLRGTPSVVIVIATAAVIFVVRDWRLSLIALTIQYLVAGFLFADVLLPHLAFTNVLMGLFIVIILYITARQVNWGKLPVDVTPDEAIQLRHERLVRLGPYMLPTDTPFRLFLAIAIILALVAITQRQVIELPVAPDHLSTTALGLVMFGTVGMSLTSEPLKAGLGLLTFMTGFQLYYSALEQSAAMLLMLIVANLILALVISYLVQSRHAYQELLD